jgi:hypothetical protein
MERQLNHRYDSQVGWCQKTLYLAFGVVVLSAACHMGSKHHPGTSPASTLRYDVGYFGTPSVLDNKPIDSNSLRLEDCLGITVVFVPMDRWPEDTLEPVESQTQMITILPTSSAVSAVAQLLRGAKVGIIQSETQVLKGITARGPAMFLPRETLHGVLLDGVNASFRILGRPVGAGAIRKVEIQVRGGIVREQESKGLPPTEISLETSLVATGEPKEAALLDAGSAASSDKGQRQSMPVASGTSVTETILLKPQDMREQDRLAVILPSPFDIEGITAVVALIEVEPSPAKRTGEGVAYPELLKQCQDYLRAEAKGSGALEEAQSGGGRRGIEDAIRLVQSLTHRRQALLYLARETGAPLIEDITLSATGAVIDRLAYAVTNECGSGSGFDPNTLGWRLERTAYLLLVELISSDQMWPELEAIGIRHTGEVGRHPPVLKEMVSEATGIADMEERLLEENFIYLEDISPSARTRAFEWLATKGRAPEGYDPLASLNERRSILNRVLQEQQ